MPPWAAGIARPGADFIAIRLDRLGPFPDRGLDSVLAHEVAHLMLERALGTERPTEIPTWFSEGFAMAEAAEFTGGHRWELGRSILMIGTMPLDTLERGWPRDGRRARAAYAQVYSLFRYILKRAGSDAAREVVARMRSGEGFRVAWRGATGRAPEDWERAWRRSVTFWYRWIPVLTSGGTVWLFAGLLFLAAYARRRQRSREVLARWEEEERFEDPHDDEWRGPYQ